MRIIQGVYGDKTATLTRFKTTYETKVSSQIKARLVLENDEVCIPTAAFYGVGDEPHPTRCATISTN